MINSKRFSCNNSCGQGAEDALQAGLVRPGLEEREELRWLRCRIARHTQSVIDYLGVLPAISKKQPRPDGRDRGEREGSYEVLIEVRHNSLHALQDGMDGRGGAEEGFEPDFWTAVLPVHVRLLHVLHETALETVVQLLDFVDSGALPARGLDADEFLPVGVESDLVGMGRPALACMHSAEFNSLE